MPDPLTDYSFDFGNRLNALGAEVAYHVTLDLAEAALLIQANLRLGRDGGAVIHVLEHLRVTRGGPYRERYSYHFQYPGEVAFRYERDERNHPEMPTHKHTTEGERVPWAEVDLEDVAAEALDVVASIEARHDASSPAS